MDNKKLKDLKGGLIAMRDSIQSFLDNIDMDEVDEKPKKKGDHEKSEKEEDDGKRK